MGDKLFWSAATIFAIIVVTSGCIQPTNEEEEIKIAVLAPLTGPNPACGMDMLVGTKLAMQAINEEFPNNNIRLVFEDTQFSPKEALTVAQKAVSQDKVKILIGECNSSSTLAIAPLAEENKVLLFTPISFAEAISDAGDYVFRSAPTAKEVAAKAAEFISQDLGEDKAAIVYLNNDYGLSAANKFGEEFEERGGQIVFESATEATETDFKTILLHLKEKEVKTVFLPHISRPAASFIKQAHELGIALTYVATNTVERKDFLNLIEGLDEEIYFVSLLKHSEEYIESNSELKRFSNKMKDQYPEELLSTEKANSYDVVRLIAKIVIEKCGENPACIKEELYKTKDYEGATGTISINSKGDVEHQQMFVNKIENGQFVPYKE